MNTKQPDNFDNIVNEVVERQNRKQNLIIFEISEQQNNLSQSQVLDNDLPTVKEVLHYIAPTYVNKQFENSAIRPPHRS